MNRKRFKHRNFAIIGCISLLVTSLAFAITACGGGNDEPVKDADYYLSLESSGWQTFNSNEMIPAEVHFTSGGDLYTLEITLEEGEKFTVNQVGSENKIGYDKIFSSADDLTNGGSGRIQVAHSGTFALSYNSADDILTYNYTAHPLSVEITSKTTTLHVGDVLPYKADVLYSDGNRKEENVAWESSNKAVITVDENGSVTALSAGTATLTATAYGFSDKLEITVEPTNVPVTGVRLDQHELSMEFGAKEKLNATVLPENADSKLVSWSSNKESVVTVTQDGTIEAVGYGTATITVTTAQGGHEDSCEVTVVKHVESMRFVSEELTVVAGGKTKDLGLVFSPSDATNKEVEIAVTSGSDKAAVDEVDGKYVLRGLAEGTATVTATLKENREITATCSVTVLAEGSELASMEQDVRVMIGATVSLEVSLEESAISSVEWTVDSEAVATVSGNGATATVTGVDFGSTVVTATVHVESGDTYIATCNVLVADEWYFVYGYGLGKADWDYADYISDKNAAQIDELLFTEQSKGVYTLTRHFTPDNGFQIIFPLVGSFTKYNDTTNKDVWSKNIPSEWVESSVYYDYTKSDTQYITNSPTYFGVNTAGVYTVTLDLTKTSAKVSIKMESLDVDAVDLSVQEGNVALKSGQEVTLSYSVSPSDAEFSADQVEVKLTSDFAAFADIVEYSLNATDKTITVKAEGNITQSFNVTMTLTIRGVSAVLTLYILSDSETEDAVTSIHFEQEHYYVNVNQGGRENAWQQVVKAIVNENATNQQVQYFDVTDYDALLPHKANTYATVNAETGLVTGKVLGTITVQAVALADKSKTATCTVTFFSDQIYLLGAGYGGWEELDPSYMSVEGTAFENQKFEQLSETHFRLTFTGHADNQFEIVFLGMDDKWLGSINYKNCLTTMSNAQNDWLRDYTQSQGGNSTQLHSNKEFTLDIDLSKHMALWTINVADSDEYKGFSLIYDKSNKDLSKGESANIELYMVPDDVEANEIKCSVDNSEYVSLSESDNKKILTLTVIKTEYADEDKQVTLSVSVKSKTITLTFTIVAEHHFVQKRDEECHWKECTDEICTLPNHIEGEKQAHKWENDAWTSSPEGHYHACTECGAQSGLEGHKYTLNDGAFDFSEGMEQCETCGFSLFEIQDGKLLSYYGYAETVQIPDSVTVIGDHVFEGHTELKTLTYANTVTQFGAYAFAGCSSLESVRVPTYLTSIGTHCFEGVAATISWAKTLRITVLGEGAFYGYLGTSLEIPKNIQTIGSDCFSHSALETMVIPSTVKNFNGRVFAFCKSLRYVDIQSPIQILRSGTFTACESLEYVIIRGDNFYQITMGVFDEACASSLKGVYIERPLSQLLTCAWLISGVSATTSGGNWVLQGKLFAYSEAAPGADPCGDAYSDHFGYYRDWFGGYWHWDESGEQELENIQLWETDETTATPTNMPVILDDKKNLYA